MTSSKSSQVKYFIDRWKHFPRHWPFVRGIHRSPVNFPHKGQWRGALMFSLICAWINDWVNNRKAGDLRRYRAHYDVSVMLICTLDAIMISSKPGNPLTQCNCLFANSDPLLYNRTNQNIARARSLAGRQGNLTARLEVTWSNSLREMKGHVANQRSNTNFPLGVIISNKWGRLIKHQQTGAPPLNAMSSFPVCCEIT